MHDQPSAEELIGAVRDFLKDRVLPNLEGHAAFHGRVAVNVLGIVKRELELSPAENADELRRLRELLDEDGTLDQLNRALCAKIRDGAIGFDTPGLVNHLWKTTLAKLAIDQPKYASYQRALEKRGKNP